MGNWSGQVEKSVSPKKENFESLVNKASNSFHKDEKEYRGKGTPLPKPVKHGKLGRW